MQKSRSKRSGFDFLDDFGGTGALARATNATNLTIPDRRSTSDWRLPSRDLSHPNRLPHFSAMRGKMTQVAFCRSKSHGQHLR
jgi:hypothetical protein